jgi:hypothetical protein
VGGGPSTLYVVNLATDAATLRGTVGDGSLEIDDIAVVDPGLIISPPTGTYTTRQVFDIVLLADTQGASVVGGTVTFDAVDVTGVIASCVRVGTTATMVSLRCPNIGGPVLGAGTHAFLVRLQMSDGTSVQRTVTWTVLPSPDGGVRPAQRALTGSDPAAGARGLRQRRVRPASPAWPRPASGRTRRRAARGTAAATRPRPRRRPARATRQRRSG